MAIGPEKEEIPQGDPSMAMRPEKEEIPQGDTFMAMRPEKEEIPQGDTFMAMRPEKEEIMKIGFIGCGNMASAMIGGILKKQVASPEEILASARTEASRRKAEEAFGIAVTEDNRRVATFADLLILAVKPFYYQEVIAEIKDSVRQETVVVSITPGENTGMAGRAVWASHAAGTHHAQHARSCGGGDELRMRRQPGWPGGCGNGVPGVRGLWKDGNCHGRTD